MPTQAAIEAINANQGNFSWMKKMGNFFHFSKMGQGHSEAINLAFNTKARMLYLPDDTKYESQWWSRHVSLDGCFNGPAYDEVDALNAATEYAKRTSIGNLTLLRQFLETSLRKSEKVGMYVEAFEQMLNTEGRKEYAKRVTSLLHVPPYMAYRKCLETTLKIDSVVKLVLGMTRKRKLLVPEWADDAQLWVSKS